MRRWQAPVASIAVALLLAASVCGLLLGVHIEAVAIPAAALIGMTVATVGAGRAVRHARLVRQMARTSRIGLLAGEPVRTVPGLGRWWRVCCARRCTAATMFRPGCPRASNTPSCCTNAATNCAATPSVSWLSRPWIGAWPDPRGPAVGQSRPRPLGDQSRRPRAEQWCHQAGPWRLCCGSRTPERPWAPGSRA